MTGAGAINDTPNQSFFIFGVYELGTYARDDVVAGIALTNVFRGPGTRAIATNIGWEGGRTYGKFSNLFTGEIIDKRFFDIPEEADLLEFFIARESPTSASVISGYAFRKIDFTLIGTVNLFSGSAEAFSDVVLSPVLFAAVLVPEPEQWALLLVGLALVGYRVSRRRQPRDAGIPRPTETLADTPRSAMTPR